MKFNLYTLLKKTQFLLKSYDDRISHKSVKIMDIRTEYTRQFLLFIGVCSMSIIHIYKIFKKKN
jgi:hypothetical protein